MSDEEKMERTTVAASGSHRKETRERRITRISGVETEPQTRTTYKTVADEEEAQ